MPEEESSGLFMGVLGKYCGPVPRPLQKVEVSQTAGRVTPRGLCMVAEGQLNRFAMLSYLPAIGPMILAVMGAVVATRLLEPKQKRRWRLAFIVVGLITALGTVYSVHSQRDALRRIEEATRGGDSCYFAAELQTLNSEGFKFMAFNRSASPIYDVYLRIRSHVDDPAYDTKEPQQIEVGNIPARGVKESNFRLRFGYYQIDIRTMYNKYTEMLKIMPFNWQIGQSYIVTDLLHGNVITKYNEPPDFPGTY